MQSTRPVFFFVENSQFCQQLIELLEQHPEIAGSLTYYDVSKQGKQGIPKDVKTIPSIYHNGKVFSGVNSMAWINEQIKYLASMRQQANASQQGSQGPQRTQQPGLSPQQIAQQQQRLAQMNGHMGPQVPSKPKLPTDAMDQPMFTGDGKQLEAYCENGICGTDLSLFGQRDETGKEFNGMTEFSRFVKSQPGNFVSINELEPEQQNQQSNQVPYRTRQ